LVRASGRPVAGHSRRAGQISAVEEGLIAEDVLQ